MVLEDESRVLIFQILLFCFAVKLRKIEDTEDTRTQYPAHKYENYITLIVAKIGANAQIAVLKRLRDKVS